MLTVVTAVPSEVRELLRQPTLELPGPVDSQAAEVEDSQAEDSQVKDVDVLGVTVSQQVALTSPANELLTPTQMQTTRTVPNAARPVRKAEVFDEDSAALNDNELDILCSEHGAVNEAASTQGSRSNRSNTKRRRVSSSWPRDTPRGCGSGHGRPATPSSRTP